MMGEPRADVWLRAPGGAPTARRPLRSTTGRAPRLPHWHSRVRPAAPRWLRAPPAQAVWSHAAHRRLL
eukprot:2864733-Pyramimonas_sp.AAC.1